LKVVKVLLASGQSHGFCTWGQCAIEVDWKNCDSAAEQWTCREGKWLMVAR